MHKLYEPWQRNADIRDRRALLVLDARTYRLSTNEDVGIMVATLPVDGKKYVGEGRSDPG
jgi:hypothetical protein